MKLFCSYISALLLPSLLMVLSGCAITSSSTGSTGVSQRQAFQIAQTALLQALGDDFTYPNNLSVVTWSKDQTKWQVVWTGAPHQASQAGNPHSGWVIIDKTTGHVDNVQTALGH